MPGILFQFLATAFEVSSYNVLRAILRALRNENNSTQDYRVHSPLSKFTSTDHILNGQNQQISPTSASNELKHLTLLSGLCTLCSPYLPHRGSLEILRGEGWGSKRKKCTTLEFLEQKGVGDGGVQAKKLSVGVGWVWIFSEATHYSIN